MTILNSLLLQETKIGSSRVARGARTPMAAGQIQSEHGRQRLGRGREGLGRFDHAVGHELPVEGPVHPFQADAVAQALPPHARTRADHGPRIKHADPDRVAVFGQGVVVAYGPVPARPGVAV